LYADVKKVGVYSKIRASDAPDASGKKCGRNVVDIGTGESAEGPVATKRDSILTPDESRGSAIKTRREGPRKGNWGKTEK